MPGPYSVASLYNAKEGKPVPYVSFSSEKSCVGELMDEGAAKLELKAPNGTLITQKDLALYRILRVADDNQVTAEECKKVLTAEGSSVPPARPIGKKTKLMDTEAVPGDCWYLLEVVTDFVGDSAAVGLAPSSSAASGSAGVALGGASGIAAAEDCTEEFVEALTPYAPEGGWEKTNSEWASALEKFLFSLVPVAMTQDPVCKLWKDSCTWLRFEAAKVPGHHMGLLTGQLYSLWALAAPTSESSEQDWQTYNERALLSLLAVAAQKREEFDHHFSTNSQTPATVTAKRPDFSATVNNALMLIGEAKASAVDHGTAMNELVEKVSWETLQWYKVPFLLAFTSAGPFVKFHVLLPPPAESGSDQPVRFALGKRFDMREPHKRLQVASVGLNIFRVMLGLKALVPTKALPLLQPTKRNVVLNMRDVTKYTEVLAPDKVYKLLGLNGTPKKLPHTVNVTEKKDKKITSGPWEGYYQLTIQPICDPDCPKPQNEDELKSAIRSVLQALSALHKAGFVHRDVRWPNILKTASGKWLLADFEHAAEEGVKMKGSDMNPELLPPQNVRKKSSGRVRPCGRYKRSGDIYRVGALVTADELPNIVLSPAARAFSAALMSEEPEDAVVDTAQALSMPWLAAQKASSHTSLTGTSAAGAAKSSSSPSTATAGDKRGRSEAFADSENTAGPAAKRKK